MTNFQLSRRRQRELFLLTSGLSTAGSFAGITAKGWILMKGTADPMVLALNFAALSLPSLLVSGPAGVWTDRFGSERVLIRAQWGLLAAAMLGAVSIPWFTGQSQVVMLLISTLMVGVAGAFESTARNKYCALIVDEPEDLIRYLTSFSVVFNTGKLVGPPIGGLLVAATGPAWALTIDAASYLLPIATVIFLLKPRRDLEQRSEFGQKASLLNAWRECGSTLRGVLSLTAALCLAGFFHPGLAPLFAAEMLGPTPQELGLFTSVLAAGSITGGLVLQRCSTSFCRRPFLTLSGFGLVTSLAQLGMASSPGPIGCLAMAFLIGAGTAGLLSSCNLITQVGAPQVIRGRMGAMSQIAFLGGGGASGLVAAWVVMATDLTTTFALTGGVGTILAVLWMYRRGGRVLDPLRSA